MDREFDIVIFGFTGFTGYYVLRELLVSMKENPSELGKLRWAVAGRSLKKLDDGLERLKKEVDFDLATAGKIEADVGNFDSLSKMAKRTRLVVNTVGPYRFYGRPVVEACVNAGTHHIDISGEPQYIEQSVLDFNKEATDNGTLVISTCGWDSIPCDLGVDFLKKNFDGTLHSVETYMCTKVGPKGYPVNFGTFQSALYGFAFGERELKATRRRLYSEVLNQKLPVSKTKISRRMIPFTNEDARGWHVEFPGSDRSVVKRTQHHNFENFGERPVQIETYFSMPDFVRMMGLLVMASVFGALSLISWGRSLLERYPHILTFGTFVKGGPSREQMDATSFQLTIVGKGWSKKTDDVQTEPDGEMDKKVIALVNGADPGYIATSTCIIQSGITILLERDSMPKGGVLTPGYAFRNTKLRERLEKRALTFRLK